MSYDKYKFDYTRAQVIAAMKVILPNVPDQELEKLPMYLTMAAAKCFQDDDRSESAEIIRGAIRHASNGGYFLEPK